MTAMDVCGFMMGDLSAWPGFSTFNFFFAAPWVLMFAGIYGCASSKLVCYHRFFGNMLLKGCIATPLARLAGAALQKQQVRRGHQCFVDGLLSELTPYHRLLPSNLGLGGRRRLLLWHRICHRSH